MNNGPTLVKLPPFLRELQRPWFGKRMDPELELYAREGARILRIKQKVFIERPLNGGDTIEGLRVEWPRLFEFMKFCAKEHFPHGEDEREVEDAKLRLKAFLAGRGVDLKVGRAPRCKEIYEKTEEILRMLPPHHMGHMHFTDLRIGCNGVKHLPVRSALYAQYDDPNVIIYPVVTWGPRRNYFAMLLHEIGHSFEKIIDKADLSRLTKALSSLPGEELAAIDYIYGSDSRKRRMCERPEESVAENYLNYIVLGQRLREFIKRLPSEFNAAWEEIISIYEKYFDGVRYA